MNLPKSVTTEWLSEVIDMSITATGNEFQIKRVEREARALLDKKAGQPEMCWLVLAFTAFLQGDRVECIRCVEAAYALAKRDAMVLLNASSLLGNIGEPRLAAIYAHRLAELSDGDPRIAINAARALCTMLHLEDAAKIMHLRSVQQALIRDDSILEDDAILRNIDEIVASFRRSNVGLEMRVAFLESAISTIRTERCALRLVMPLHYPDEDTMRYEFYARASARQCGHLNFAIAEALTEKFDDTHPELITFACRPLESYRPTNASVEVLG